MKRHVSTGLKVTFLVHFVIAGVVGLQHLIAPRIWTDLAGMQIDETVTWRVIGAAVLAFAAGSWMAYRERRWARVRLVVLMEIVWSVLGAAVILWGILVEGIPPLEWLNVALLAGFAAAFAYFWSTHERAVDGPPEPTGQHEHF